MQRARSQQQQQPRRQQSPWILLGLWIVPVTATMKSLGQLLRWLWGFLQNTWRRWSWAPVLRLDSGLTVRMGRKIAEGGFSLVFQATDAHTSNPTTYALKRIRCNDAEILQRCRREAGVHRSIKHPNVMPLLGMTIKDGTECFMLFPFMSHSLRQEVNRRTLDHAHEELTKHAPWRETVALTLFWNILQGVQAMHAAGYSHRDIKLENILLADMNSRQPVLMDFGSVGPLQEPIQTRRQVLQKIEDASMHTTAPYRPPELFEGGVRAGDAALDYTKVDVWSLGCTLFAVLYGASPSESEFRTNGHLRIVECSQLKVLKASLPEPPAHSPVASWYSLDTHQLVQAMLTQDRHKRPTLAVVKDKLQALIQQQGGRVERTVEHAHSDHDDDDETDTVGIALMSNRNFV